MTTNPPGASDHPLKTLAPSKARPTGLEPATPGSTVRYSNQLSYGPDTCEANMPHALSERNLRASLNSKQAAKN